MNVLYLGNESPIVNFLREEGHVVTCHTDILPPSYFAMGVYDCIISYGYRHKLSQSAIDSVKGKAVNLHISYLPYNRGANPNFWSWFDDTPKGVTIHYIDNGFDTGDIIVQKQVVLTETQTLRETYAVLQQEIQDLFIENWKTLFTIIPRKQEGNGTSHLSKQWLFLPQGWDTKCNLIKTVGKVNRAYAHRTFVDTGEA